MGILYTFWPPLTQTGEQRTIVLAGSSTAPGDDLLRELRGAGFSVAGWDCDDRRASTTTPRGTISATAHALDLLTRALSSDRGLALENITVVASGPLAHAVLTWAHDYAPRVRCVVAASSGLLCASSASRIIEDDGACVRRIVQDAAAIEVPLLVMTTDADDMLRDTGAAIIRQLAKPSELAVVARDTSQASVRQAARDTLRRFLRDVYSKPSERPSLLNAHEHGFTKDELDRFLQPLPFFSKRGIRLALAKASIRSLGLLSHGMRIGLQTGFDSGSSMEYVYANVPSGVTTIGRRLDASYLNSPGWVAIRERRRNVQRRIAETARWIQQAGRELHVLDIAAGHGRYVMDALLELRHRPQSVRLQEYVDANVQRGRALLRELGLADIAAFVHGDAFDGAALAALRPRPTLAIACGIYELFPDNARVIDSLNGLSRAMEPDSCLLYTNQPYQPLLEFFVRVVPSHRRDQNCVVRRRTQAEMDQLVALAGFTKISQITDPQGIFSVSVARKIPHPE